MTDVILAEIICLFVSFLSSARLSVVFIRVKSMLYFLLKLEGANLNLFKGGGG